MAELNNLEPVLCCDDKVNKGYRSVGSDAFRIFFNKLLDGAGLKHQTSTRSLSGTGMVSSVF